MFWQYDYVKSRNIVATQSGSRKLSLGYNYYFIIGNFNEYPRLMVYGHSENIVYRDNLLGIDLSLLLQGYDRIVNDWEDVGN